MLDGPAALFLDIVTRQRWLEMVGYAAPKVRVPSLMPAEMERAICISLVCLPLVCGQHKPYSKSRRC